MVKKTLISFQIMKFFCITYFAFANYMTYVSAYEDYEDDGWFGDYDGKYNMCCILLKK